MNLLNNVVLISGKKRSGKDFLAKKLKHSLEKSGKTVEIMAFADPIKEILAKTLDISVNKLDDLKNQEYELSYFDRENRNYQNLSNSRKLIQRFGTEAMQSVFGKDVWVNLLKKKVKESPADFVIVPDFRFKSEAISSFSILVYNDALKVEDDHQSENGLNDYDFSYIVNNTNRPNLDEITERLTEDLMNNVL